MDISAFNDYDGRKEALDLSPRTVSPPTSKPSCLPEHPKQNHVQPPLMRGGDMSTFGRSSMAFPMRFPMNLQRAGDPVILDRLIKANLALSNLKSNNGPGFPFLGLGSMRFAPSPECPLPRSPPNELHRVSQESIQSYNQFRESMLWQFRHSKAKRKRRDSNGSTAEDDNKSLSSSPNSPATSVDTSPEVNSQPQSKKSRRVEEIKDEAYWERRKKNNEAAKRSRDARRAKEDEIAIRAAFLEQENIQLKWEVARMKSETGRLRALILNDSASDSSELHSVIMDNGS
ncbi:D site-binding protein-like [Tigriopus californicus]|uniref:D site-binding protein-like n=1 Tax=Tigriopus californicus TaxID=6832 RepID=UPI0027D9EA6C|nr:D site-binding protein-like [Tigriopus californicus]